MEGRKKERVLAKSVVRTEDQTDKQGSIREKVDKELIAYTRSLLGQATSEELTN